MREVRSHWGPATGQYTCFSIERTVAERRSPTIMVIEDLKQRIREIPDFPKAGILFRDITPLLSDGQAFRQAIDFIGGRYLDRKIDVVVGVEARGFIMGSALAYKLGAGNALVRKHGKLPFKTNRTTYALEYGTDTLEIHQDAITPGQRVVLADDLLATGGTISAAAELVRQLGGEIVELAFLIELTRIEWARAA